MKIKQHFREHRLSVGFSIAIFRICCADTNRIFKKKNEKNTEIQKIISWSWKWIYIYICATYIREFSKTKKTETLVVTSNAWIHTVVIILATPSIFIFVRETMVCVAARQYNPPNCINATIVKVFSAFVHRHSHTHTHAQTHVWIVVGKIQETCLRISIPKNNNHLPFDVMIFGRLSTRRFLLFLFLSLDLYESTPHVLSMDLRTHQNNSPSTSRGVHRDRISFLQLVAICLARPITHRVLEIYVQIIHARTQTGLVEKFFFRKSVREK